MTSRLEREGPPRSKRSRRQLVARVVGDGDQAQACADRLRMARFQVDAGAGAPDVLVLAPALPGDGRTVRELPLAELDQAWQRTVIDSLQAIQDALAAMVERGAGTVLVVVPGPSTRAEAARPMALTELLTAGALTSIVPVLSREVSAEGIRSVTLVADAPRVTAEVVLWLVRPEPDSVDGPPVLMLDGETLLAGAVAHEYGLV